MTIVTKKNNYYCYINKKFENIDEVSLKVLTQ